MANYPFNFKEIRNAQEILNSRDPENVQLVRDCYNAVLALYSEGGVQACLKEWTGLSIEECDTLFDEIYRAIEITEADAAAAWC